MAALTSSRASRTRTVTVRNMTHIAQQVYQGGIACIDTSDGNVKKATASTTLIPIGTYVEDKLVAAGDLTALVEFFRELQCKWFANDGTDTVVAADVGSNCFLVDDQTVANADATNTRSIAGRVLAVDATKGVLVCFRDFVGANTDSGLDV